MTVPPRPGQSGRPGGSGWFEADAGPTVRPYAISAGRTRPATGRYDLITIVLATGAEPPAHALLAPEALRILTLCRRPLSVAEIAAYLDLPAGTVKVLLGDLGTYHLIHTRAPVAPTGPADEPLLQAVMNGLRDFQ